MANGLVLLFEGKFYEPQTADDFYTKCRGCDLAKPCNYGCIEECNSFCDYWRKTVKGGESRKNVYLQFKEVK